MLGITRKTVKPTKEKLRNFGLIQFETKNGFSLQLQAVTQLSLKLEPVIQDIESKDNPQKGNDDKFGLALRNNPKIMQKKDRDVPPIYDKDKLLSSGKIPTFRRIFEYAQTLKVYETSMDSHIKEKYNDWSNNS